jgi:hypothetical protein
MRASNNRYFINYCFGVSEIVGLASDESYLFGFVSIGLPCFSAALTSTAAVNGRSFGSVCLFTGPAVEIEVAALCEVRSDINKAPVVSIPIYLFSNAVIAVGSVIPRLVRKAGNPVKAVASPKTHDHIWKNFGLVLRNLVNNSSKNLKNKLSVVIVLFLY